MTEGNHAADLRSNLSTEVLRQATETFNHRLKHERRWSVLRLVLGYTVALIYAVILVASLEIIFEVFGRYDLVIMQAASGALFVESVAAVLGLYQFVLKSRPNEERGLQPTLTVAQLEQILKDLG